MFKHWSISLRRGVAVGAILLTLGAACTAPPAPTNPPAAHADHAEASTGGAAALAAVTLAAGESLQVAATTSIIGDIVAQIGGDHITLFTLMGPGVDPHSYTPTPQDLRTLSDVDAIFINGLHLEEGLEDLLSEGGAPQIVVNAAVTPLANPAEHSEEAQSEANHTDDHDHGPNDPHTWQNVANVMQWVTTIETSLSALDPAHTADYHAAAEAYLAELTTLESTIRAEVATIPAAQRKLVTDHETLNYFAHAYGFTIIGAIIPSLSSLAASSAQELAALQAQIRAEGVPAIFVGTTVNPALAEQLAADLGITVVPLYSDALSAADGPAATYLDFMRYNVNAIVTALKSD